MSLLNSLFGADQKKTTIDSALDMITRAAGLASNPRDIDPLLDDVRAVTSKLRPGDSPTASEETKLLTAYLHIEQYLTTREPIRVFTKQELRSKVSPRLRARLEAYEEKE